MRLGQLFPLCGPSYSVSLAMLTHNPDAPQISAWLVLSGNDFDSNACTDTIGLQPTSVWRQAHEHLRDRTDLDNMSWSYGYETRRGYDIDEVIQELLNDVRPCAASITQFSLQNKLKVSVTCNVTINSDRPLYKLSPNSMQGISELNAEFLMDIFDYSE